MMNETERLCQRTKEYQEDLRKDRERRKPKPNQRMDDDIPQVLSSYDFWCEDCQCHLGYHRMKKKWKVDPYDLNANDKVRAYFGLGPVDEE